ncbi:MAG: AraC family ligand binding domain-containing protein, partial [Oscillospiraceae bacterium]|nr:AraC family ligand binding domain-containing protein [Oscillospiraceae bacterium]
MLFLNIDEFESKDKIYVNKNVYSPLIKAHSHKFFEIIYIYNGTGKHVINGVSHDAARGSLFFLNYNVEHYFESASSSFSLLNCAFLPSAIDESLSYTENASDLLKLPMFEIYKKEKIDLSVSVNIHGLYKEFEDILFAMNDEYTEKNIGYQSILR